MKFVDRKAEMERLAGMQAPGLGVIWGRRRVGKTRLLLEWCRKSGGLYTVADQSAETIQRRYFAEAIATRIHGFADVVYPDWRALFNALAREVGRGGLDGPIIIDEVPYLVASSPALASVLQAFVDHEGREAGVLMVLAGSSQRMMHGLVLDGSAPLYGRARESFEITPLSPGYIAEALDLSDPVDGLKAYSAWGGIPWYWELAQPYHSDLDGAVDALVLDCTGPLHHEPDRLLVEEQPTAVTLRPVLDAIGSGAHRLSEVAARLGQPATSLSRPLSRLVELGLVRREQPFGSSERTAKRTLYRIADPFLRLWFHVVARRRGLLVASPPSVRRRIWQQARTALFAESWEEICRRAVPYLGDRLPGSFGHAGRYWRGEGREWDVVSRSVDGSMLLLGECKWLEGQADEATLDRTYRELVGKGLPDSASKQPIDITYVVFVPKASPNAGKGKPYVVLDGGQILDALSCSTSRAR